jgi:serine/threonine-protein kinase HipA
LLPAEAAQEVAQVIAVVDTWQAHFANVGVSNRDIESLARFIDSDELLTQRRIFDPATFTVENAKNRKSPKGPRRSPFSPN